MSTHSIGNRDLPVDPNQEGHDLLNVGPYIKGLSEFIQNCPTPMTIAIQGDWGTGKTSMMKMIDHQLQQISDQKPLTVWFNTWQYSQFNMEDNLQLSLINYLVEKISPEEKKKDMRKRLIKLAKGAAVFGMRTIIDQAGLSTDHLPDVEGETEMQDVAREVESLKEQFAKAVGMQPYERVIIFIDDLDRLNPEIAVGVLETLKLFLDVPGCVYILAVDAEVVMEGVHRKFGNQVSRLKGKSFFDKMIQLPFKVPVEQFKLERFLEKQLGQAEIGNVGTYEKLVRASVGMNPRSINRLFNSFQLIKKIFQYEQSSHEEEHRLEILFAILCLQLSYEPLYEYFVDNQEWIDAQSVNNIFNGEDEGIKTKIGPYIEKDEQPDDRTIRRMYAYIQLLNEVIHQKALQTNDEQKYELDADKLKLFQQVLFYSSLTSTTGSGDGNSLETLNLNEELDTSEYNITRIRFNNVEKSPKNFTQAVVELLTILARDEKYGPELQKIAHDENLMDQANIARRFFKTAADPDMKKVPPSSFKEIKTEDGNSTLMTIVTHYSGKDLKAILLKVLKALDINPEEVVLLGQKK